MEPAKSMKKTVRRSGGIRIVVKSDAEPENQEDTDKTIYWLFRCLGFGDENNRLAREVFRELITNRGKGLRSKEIQEKTGVTQGAVVYHLNSFRRAGMIVKRGRYYYLKHESLYRTLEEMELRILRRFEIMKKLAIKLEENL